MARAQRAAALFSRICRKNWTDCTTFADSGRVSSLTIQSTAALEQTTSTAVPRVGWRHALYSSTTLSDSNGSPEISSETIPPSPPPQETEDDLQEQTAETEDAEGMEDQEMQLEDGDEAVVEVTEEGEEVRVELDTEKTKDFLEEDEVFTPAALRQRLDGKIDFSKFVKWPQYKEAIDELGDRVQLGQIVAAFSALRTVLPRPPDQFLNDLSRIAIRCMAEARSNQVARLYYYCAKLRYINSSLMQAMGMKLLEDRLVLEMDGCDVMLVIYALGILTRFQLLVFAVEKGMRVVDLYQLYTHETPPTLFRAQTEVVHALSKEIAVPNRLATFKESELASTIYGYGLLRASEPAAINALAREISDSYRVLKFTPQEISNVFYGLGLVDFKETSALYAISNNLLRMGRLKELETQHLANILYGFSRMGFSYAPMLDALVKEIKTPGKLRRLREQELANIVSCAALIGIKDESLYVTLGKEIIKPERLPKFMEHNFSTIVLGLANVGVRDTAVLKALAAEMKQPHRLPNYTSKDICDIIMGFNNLEFLDDGFMLGLVAELRKPERIRRCDMKVWQSCRAHVFSWSLAFPF